MASLEVSRSVPLDNTTPPLPQVAGYIHPEPDMYPRYPFVMKRAIMSRAYISHFVISLAFLIWRLYSMYEDIDEQTAIVKERLLRECREIERVANEFLNLQRIVAERANAATTQFLNYTIQKTVRILIAILDMIIELLISALLIIQSVITCFIQALLTTTLDVLIKFAEQVEKVLEGLLNAGRVVFNGINNGIEKSANFFKNLFRINKPDIDLPSIEKIELPFDIQESLKRARDAIPPYDFVGTKVGELISKPANETISKLNSRADELKVRGDIFRVPSIRNASFCDASLQTQTIDQIADGFKTILIACMALTGFIILLTIAIKIYLVWKRFSKYEARVEAYVADFRRQERRSLNEATVHGLYYGLNRGKVAEVANTFANSVSRTPLGRRRVLWTLDYLFHKPSFICIAVGMFGLLLGFVQLQGLDQLEQQHLPQLVRDMNGTTFAMVGNVNDTLYNNTGYLVETANRGLQRIQDGINRRLFEPAGELAEKVQFGVQAFMNDSSQHVKLSLAVPIFDAFLMDFAKCFLSNPLRGFLKILEIIEGMRVDLPKLDQQLFLLNQTAIDRTAKRVQQVTIGDPVYDEEGHILRYQGGVIPDFIDRWRRRVWREILYSGITLGFGLLIVLQAAIANVYFFFKTRKLRI